MSPEISINETNETPPYITLSSRQLRLVDKAHTFDGGRSGDTFIGKMKIYREPESLMITIRGEKQIILEQTRVATSELGVKSRIKLTESKQVDGHALETVYRCNEELGIKAFTNGQQSEATPMTDQDFEDANALVGIIEEYLRLV